MLSGGVEVEHWLKMRNYILVIQTIVQRYIGLYLDEKLNYNTQIKGNSCIEACSNKIEKTQHAALAVTGTIRGTFS